MGAFEFRRHGVWRDIALWTELDYLVTAAACLENSHPGEAEATIRERGRRAIAARHALPPLRGRAA